MGGGPTPPDLTTARAPTAVRGGLGLRATYQLHAGRENAMGERDHAQGVRPEGGRKLRAKINASSRRRRRVGYIFISEAAVFRPFLFVCQALGSERSLANRASISVLPTHRRRQQQATITALHRRDTIVASSSQIYRHGRSQHRHDNTLVAQRLGSRESTTPCQPTLRQAARAASLSS